MDTYQPIEQKYFSNGYKLICGVDEAGRGPLAGPVVAASVIFPEKITIRGIDDSKVLTKKQRDYLFSLIINQSVSYAIRIESHTIIDEINILNASLKAMSKAVLDLKSQPDIILVDGNKSLPGFSNSVPIIKGDSKCFTIAAASILAKVYRDSLMDAFSKEFIYYGFENNKGYPTKQHIKAILEYGECRIHRKTFMKKIYARRDTQLQFQFSD